MRSVALDALKVSLEEYVSAASSGETVLVTDKDRVVAQIGPPAIDTVRADRDAGDEAWLAEMERQGLVRRARRSRDPAPARNPTMPLSELLAELDRDREDR